MTQKKHYALLTELFWFYLKRMEAYVIGRYTTVQYTEKIFAYRGFRKEVLKERIF